MNSSSFKNAKILIVDDQETNIDILTSLLEIKGYTNIVTATDPRKVAGLFHTFQPDLILLDLMMPYMTGYEVMEQLNTLIPRGSYLPVLVLTADITAEAKQRALSGGAKDFLAKPYDLTEVGLRISNLLFARYYHQQLENQNHILEDMVSERTASLEKAFRELDIANRELLNLNQAKLDFLQLISHEIRTPLNGIKGCTDLLKSEIRSPELLQYLEYLETSVERLEKFSYQALLITDLRTGNRKPVLKEVLLRDLWDHTRNLLQNKIESKKMHALIRKDPEIQSIKGDQELLQLCFDCVADNAIKHSPDNAVIVIHVFSGDQTTICEFIDHGQGFSALALNHLYQLFGLGEQHIDQNTGLNLALAKLIMDAHHGQIEVMNNPDKGATVRLTFKK